MFALNGQYLSYHDYGVRTRVTGYIEKHVTGAKEPHRIAGKNGAKMQHSCHGNALYTWGQLALRMDLLGK